MATKVWLHVLACAAGSDVVRFGMTCQAASLLATDASLWRTLCLRQKQHQRYAPPAEPTKEGEAQDHDVAEYWKRRWFAGALAPPRPHLRLAIVGHIDCGKSTLLGQLMIQLGAVSRGVVASTRKKCVAYGRQCGAYIAMLSQDAPHAFQEHVGGPDSSTIVRYLVQLEASRSHLSIFCPSSFRTTSTEIAWMLAVSNCVVLVVSALPGEFEAGLSRDGQTRSDLKLAVEAGVRRVIVAVNKCETTPISRWNEITAEMATLAQRLQFDGDLLVLAISAVDGDNVTTRSFRFPWYSGPTLLEAIEQTGDLPCGRQLEAKIFEPCSVSVLVPGKDGHSVVGFVRAGVVKKGHNLHLVERRPNTQPRVVTVTGIVDSASQERPRALPGDIVLISFSSAKTGEPASQSRGASPIALSAHTPKEVDEIRIEAITLRHNGFKLGMSLLLHCDGVWSDCTFGKVLAVRVGSGSWQEPPPLKLGDPIEGQVRMRLRLQLRLPRALSTLHVPVGRPITLQFESGGTVAAGTIISASLT